MNLAYLAVPIIIGLVIGASAFVIQKVDLTGRLVSPDTSAKLAVEEQETAENTTKCPLSCDDKNSCSIDWCNETSNYLCSHTPINGTSDECRGDPTTCNTNTCVAGKCTDILLAHCCGNNIG